MATRAAPATVWATIGGSASRATIAIWSAAVGPATTTSICATTRGATAVGSATTLLCATTTVSSTTPMGNATTLSTNGYTKGLVNYTLFVYFPGNLSCSSFLYWLHCNRFDSTVYLWWLWYLVAY